MFAFPVFALPLGYLSLVAWFFPRHREEALARSFSRGLALGILCALIHSIALGWIPEAYGSPLFVFRIWWERFLLPFSLALSASRLLLSFEDMVRSDAALRRFTAFLFGVFTILSLASAVRYAGDPDPFVLFFYPVLTVAGIFGALFFLERAVTEAGIYAVLWVAAGAAASLAFAFIAYLFEARLEWLGAILSLSVLGITAYKVRFLMN